MTTVSFIVPAYNEVDNIQSFYREFSDCFNESPYAWDLIFIDDGSTDATWRELEQLTASAPHVTAISFSRNFGKEAAIWAGLKNATGDYVGIIDCDLQQPPQDALAMCDILARNPEADCVAAFQEHRKESKVMTRIKAGFYSFFAKLSGMNAIQDASDFRVFRHRVAEAILELPENFRFSKGIFAWVGFNTVPYAYTPAERASGESKWSVIKLVKYAIEGMLSFSVKPLRIATGLGMIASFCAVAYFLFVFIRTLVVGVEVPGYATLLCVMLLLGGAQLVCMGIIGEYLARAYLQGKSRPIYIERKRCESKGA